MAVKSVGAKVTPEAQLRSLIEKFDPEDQRLIRSVRSAVRKRLPTANELVYDYGFSLVIAYSPTEQGIEGASSLHSSGSCQPVETSGCRGADRRRD